MCDDWMLAGSVNYACQISAPNRTEMRAPACLLTAAKHEDADTLRASGTRRNCTRRWAKTKLAHVRLRTQLCLAVYQRREQNLSPFLPRRLRNGEGLASGVERVPSARPPWEPQQADTCAVASAATCSIAVSTFARAVRKCGNQCRAVDVSVPDAQAPTLFTSNAAPLTLLAGDSLPKRDNEQNRAPYIGNLYTSVNPNRTASGNAHGHQLASAHNCLSASGTEIGQVRPIRIAEQLTVVTYTQEVHRHG